MPRTADATVDRIINRAKEYVGFRSRSHRVNDFGGKFGMSGQPWDGAFLETVLREEKLTSGPSLVSTTASYAAFNRANRVFRVPRRGDIVYLAWSIDEPLGQPHTGIVTDVKDWKRYGKFRTVEGMASSGLPRGPKEADGVYERTRYAPEVLGFARPKYRDLPKPTAKPEDFATLRPSTVPQRVTDQYENSTVLLQLALHDVTGVSGLNRGVYDSLTRAAVSDFQRRIAHLNANGYPDYRTLSALAYLTENRYFQAKE